MIYEGSEHTITSNQSPLQLFKGPEQKIKLQPLQDGAIYFATDTKKIYLDCDFTDSLKNKLHDRIAFGGSTGIYYAQHDFKDDDGVNGFLFTQDDFDNAEEVPMVDDLILNDTDGSFYRVTEVEDYSENGEIIFELRADRLTVSGNGGGGGGGSGGSTAAITTKIIGGRTKYWSYNSDYMPISFSIKLADPEETIGYRVYIGDSASTTPRMTVSGKPQSTDENPTVINLAELKEYFSDYINRSVTVSVMPFGDDGTEANRAMKFTVSLFDLYLTPFSEDLGVKIGSFDNYTVIPHFGAELENVKLQWQLTNMNGDVMNSGSKNLVAQNSGTQVSLIIGQYNPGTYHIITWIQADIPASDGQIITSEKLDQLCSWANSAMDIPILSVQFPTGSYKQYNSIDIPFVVYYGQATIAVKKYVIFTDENNVKTTTLLSTETIQTNSQAPIWNYKFSETGKYQFRLVVGDNAVVQNSQEYIVEGISAEVPIIATSNLAVNMVPTKTNDSDTKEIWENSGVNQNIRTEFTNVNWISNGWSRDEEGVPILHLDNKAKVEIKGFSPFAYPGAQANQGMTIELDVKISNIKDRDANIITCWSYSPEDDVLNTGIVANGDFICLNGSEHTPIIHWVNGLDEVDEVTGLVVKSVPKTETGLMAYYCEGERVRVSFVITPAGTGNIETLPRGFIYTYVNGVISGLVKQEQNETFQDNPQFPSYFVFDSTNADIDIYGIRVYTVALDDATIVSNYLATFGDDTLASNLYSMNKILNTEGRISLTKIKEFGTIPYLVLRGGRACKKKLDKFDAKGNAKEVDLPSGQDKNAKDRTNAKYDFRFMEAYYENPLTGYKIGSPTNREIVSVYGQGTSSIQYPVKNLRIKFWKKNKTVNNYTPLFDGKEAKKNKVKIYEEQPAAASVYTAKADYMDSSSAHNTGTGNALVQLYNTHRSLAQKIDNKKLTAITGIPMVIFWKRYKHEVNASGNDIDDLDIVTYGIKPVDETQDKDSDYEYIGRYNFNLDKSEATLFGFESNVEDHYGVRLASDNIYATVNGASDAAAALKQIPVQENSFRALIDDDDDLTYDPERTYYLEPKLGTDQIWTPADPEKGDDELEEELGKHPVYVLENAETGANSIECWEFLSNNTSKTTSTLQLQFEQDQWTEEADPDGENFMELFESRYPEYIDQHAADRRSYIRLLNWIASTNAIRVGHEPDAETLEKYKNGELQVPDNLTPIYPDPTNPKIPEIGSNGIPRGVAGILYKDDPTSPYVRGVKDCHQDTANVTFYYDSFEYRLHRFKSEFDTYMIKDMTLIYYILTELLVAKDSRAKNMMMCCFDANPERNCGHWYPIFYDMDTILGVDNVGKLRYRYDDEDYDYGVMNTNADYYDDDGVTVAQNYSVLWSNIRRTMYDEIAELYREMRNNALTYSNLVSIYNTNLADSWNETMVNQDIWYKFVRFLTGYKNPAAGVGDTLVYTATDLTSSEEWLPAVQGTRSLHRKQFLRRRLAFLDGKYAYSNGGSSITYRDSAGTEGADDGREVPRGYVNLTFRDTGFFAANVGNNVVSGPFKVKEKQTKLLHIHSSTGLEQDGVLYFANFVDDFGDLSGQRYSNLVVNSNDEYPMRTRFLDLTNSRENYSNTFSISASNMLSGVGFCARLPYLEELNVSYLKTIGTISLTNNKYIRKVYAYGTSCGSIALPRGGVLELLQLPKTLTNLTIYGHRQLSEVTIEDNNWSKVQTLNVQACPLVDTQSIFENLSGSLMVYLPDLDWTFDSTQVVLDEFDVVASIPLLDKLLLANGAHGEAAKTEQGEFITDRTYVGGTITILNGKDNDPNKFGFNESVFYEKYGQYYPNLIPIFEPNSLSKQAYTVNALSSSSQIVKKLKFKESDSGELIDFSWNAIFEDGGITPQLKGQEYGYDYHFVGWNLEGNRIFEEEDLDNNYTLAQAYEAAYALLVAHYNEDENFYDQEHVSISLDKNSFNAETRELNLYPTFVGTVRYHNLIIYDAEGEIYSVQSVRHNTLAEVPTVPPLKVFLDPNDVSITNVYELDHYEPDITRQPIVVDDTLVYPEFKAVPISAKSFVTDVTDDSMFKLSITNESINTTDINPSLYNYETSFSGLALQIKSTYKNAFITIPKQAQYNGQTYDIIKFERDNNDYCSSGLRRVYFEGDDHPLRIIENQTFNGCADLEYFEFAACPKLYRIGNINNATSVESGAFAGCYQLRQVSFPNSLQIIGHYSFRNNEQEVGTSSLLNFTKLPDFLQYIGNYGFYRNPNIGEIQVGNYIKMFGNYCFAKCTNLTFATPYFFAGTREVGTRAFEDCSNLEINYQMGMNQTYNISTSLTKIQYRAFRNCSKLSLPILPACLKEIGDQAFYGIKQIGSNDNYNPNRFFSQAVNPIILGAEVFGSTTKLYSPELVVSYPADQYTIGDSLFDCTGTRFTYEYSIGSQIGTKEAPEELGGGELPVFMRGNGFTGNQLIIYLKPILDMDGSGETKHDVGVEYHNWRDFDYFNTEGNNPWKALFEHMEQKGLIQYWYETQSGSAADGILKSTLSIIPLDV